jgi:hypothetical protein
MIVIIFILKCLNLIILELSISYNYILGIEKKIFFMETYLFYALYFKSTEIHFKIILETDLFLYLYLFNQIYFYLHYYYPF